MAIDYQVKNVLNCVYKWSTNESFRGYNKHDGLNSPILMGLLGWSKWSRIIAIQTVMRAPINIRPFLLVPKTINPKGLALFALGVLERHKSDPQENHLKEAERILDMLISCRSQGDWAGHCWGYPYPWQDLGFFAKPHMPNAVVTCFVCEAFLEAFRLSRKRKYLEVVESAIKFFLNDLTVLVNNEASYCLGYMPLPMSMKVMDVSILIGAVIAQYSQLCNDTTQINIARRLVQFVVHKQTKYAAWYYTDPPGDSLIRHDNYHTGFILDALWRYMSAADDWQWKENYEKGLEFYAENLFNNDGSPRWMSDKDYPHDVHGSAQGLVSFSLAVNNGYPYNELLKKISEWAITNLYQQNGKFFYRQNKYWTTKYTLLRWCNAWMFRGLSASISCIKD